jgi:hypothetical protein
LLCLKDNNGTPFISDKDREKHIVDFFSDIYSKPKQDPPIDYTRCIEEFLEQEILNNPVVTNSKLTVQEREDLDRPLILGDLDESSKNCNLKSAPGADRFSNKLITLC